MLLHSQQTNNGTRQFEAFGCGQARGMTRVWDREFGGVVELRGTQAEVRISTTDSKPVRFFVRPPKRRASRQAPLPGDKQSRRKQTEPLSRAEPTHLSEAVERHGCVVGRRATRFEEDLGSHLLKQRKHRPPFAPQPPEKPCAPGTPPKTVPSPLPHPADSKGQGELGTQTLGCRGSGDGGTAQGGTENSKGKRKNAASLPTIRSGCKSQVVTTGWQDIRCLIGVSSTLGSFWGVDACQGCERITRCTRRCLTLILRSFPSSNRILTPASADSPSITPRQASHQDIRTDSSSRLQGRHAFFC